jgi:hypothetical protein
MSSEDTPTGPTGDVAPPVEPSIDTPSGPTGDVAPPVEPSIDTPSGPTGDVAPPVDPSIDTPSGPTGDVAPIITPDPVVVLPPTVAELCAPIMNSTDMNSVHSYANVYESLFSSRRNDNINLLQIGLNFGGAIHVWREYFPNSTIYLVDQGDHDTGDLFTTPRGIAFMNSDAYSHDFVVNNFTNNNIKFDIIIEDQSDRNYQKAQSTIVEYSSLLNVGGMLFIEDIQDINWTTTLMEYVPEELKANVQIFDLRENKGTWDDILFMVKN